MWYLRWLNVGCLKDLKILRQELGLTGIIEHEKGSVLACMPLVSHLRLRFCEKMRICLLTAEAS